MAETPIPPPNQPKPGGFGGLRSLLSRAKGVAALAPIIGPIIGWSFIALIPIVAVTFIALYFAKGDDIRSPYTEGGGNTAGLELQESNITLFVTTYYPGMGNTRIEGPCYTASSGDPTKGDKGDTSLARYYLRKADTGEIVDYCNFVGKELADAIADPNYQLVSVFNHEQTWVANGGVAVNNSNWPSGTTMPIAGRTKSVRSGTTYWLEIPGLDDLVPVIDHFGGATTDNHNAQAAMLKTGRDMRYRVDFAVKADGDRDQAQVAAGKPNRITAALKKMNCQGTANGSVYTCEVKGVNIYYGNYFANKGTGTVADIIRIAKNELGVKEEGNNAGPGIQKYYQGAGGKNGDPWCAFFLTWVLNQAGVKITHQGSVDALRDEVKSKFKFFESGAEAPQPGDIFFEPGYHHTGLVEEVNGDTVKVIEGNAGGVGAGKVKENTYPINHYVAYGRVVK